RSRDDAVARFGCLADLALQCRRSCRRYQAVLVFVPGLLEQHDDLAALLRARGDDAKSARGGGIDLLLHGACAFGGKEEVAIVLSLGDGDRTQYEEQARDGAAHGDASVIAA